jgi:hypothetical protein
VSLDLAESAPTPSGVGPGRAATAYTLVSTRLFLSHLSSSLDSLQYDSRNDWSKMSDSTSGEVGEPPSAQPQSVDETHPDAQPDGTAPLASVGGDLEASQSGPMPASRAVAKPRRTTKRATKKRSTAKKVGSTSTRKTPAKTSGTGGRIQRSFPAASFEDAMELANTLQKIGAERARRLTVFDELGRSADSGASRQLVINSGRYGLTTGGMQAEFLELTELGRTATSPDAPPRQQLRARFQLAIESIPPFKLLYDEFAGKRFPTHSVLKDFLRESSYAEAELQECVDTFTVNARFLGLLRTVAGAERLLSIEHVLDNISDTRGAAATEVVPPGPGAASQPSTGAHDWSKVCFYVTPIGAEDSEQRLHSDLFLGSIVEPALAAFEMDVVRADQIGKPGLITAQVIEHIVNSRLVIADLSFHNPNVFYEVALRHACRKPIVQIIRIADPIPFDLDQVRTIKVDTTNIYSLVPQIESYRSEIANQVRRALEGTGPIENPLTVFFPSFWDAIVRNPGPQ